WRVPRREDTSWTTPIVVVHAGKPQVIVPGTHCLRGHDLETGGLLWECRGLSSNVVASPVAAHGVVYAGSSYETRSMLAVRREGVTEVLSHGTATPKVLAVNRLDDTFSASAALAGRDMVLRGERFLYCLASE